MGRRGASARCALAAVLCGLASVALSHHAHATAGDAGFTVGIVFDGKAAPEVPSLPAQRRAELLRLIESELAELTSDEFQVDFPPDKRLAGDWDLEHISQAIDVLMVDSEVDLVLGAGVYATNALVRRKVLPKPAVAVYAVDIEAQSLPFDGRASGRKNLNYQIAPGSVIDDLRRFREIVPFSRVHLILDSLAPLAIPDLDRYSERASAALGMQIDFVLAGTSASEVLQVLPVEAEAVYLTPLLRMPDQEFRRLVDGLIERRLPSFSLIGEAEVELGVMAAARAATELPRLARRIALNIQRVLKGEDAGTLPVLLDATEKLFLNMATARAIDLPLRWRALMSAELLHEQDSVAAATVLTLSDAVRQAVETNLGLRARRRDVEAGAEEIAQARAALKPQIDLSALGLRIDEDRAEASFGSQAERSASGSLAISQLVYSDEARAAIEISTSRQQAREHDLDALRLDIALEAARAFLDVLRAETLHDVERDNLRLTQRNLELARRRQVIGYSGPAEVYRWESEVASGLTAVIRAHSAIQAARVRVNQLRHRPLEEPFRAEPPTLEDPQLLTGGRLQPFLDTRQGFDTFREFLVLDGLAHARELQAIEATLTAQQRLLTAAQRSFWSPVIGLKGEVEREFSRAGAGSAGPPAGFPDVAADRDDWSVALSATLPLYGGGRRAARARAARLQLDRVVLERNALAEAVESRVRVTAFAAGGSFPAIELSRQAAEAAAKNLDLVTDAYSRGVVTIIDLLDAQNAARVAELAAANAVFDFLLDLMELQRATNDFGFFMSEDGREAWYRRLQEFFERVRPDVAPPPR